MRIGFTSQNFRTITGHAGRTRRFLVYELDTGGTATEVERLDFPVEMTLHAFHGAGPHPLDALDVLVTKECGPEFRVRMARRGVTVVVSAEDTDPASVLRAIAENRLDISPPAITAADADHGHHHHHHHDHGHDDGHPHDPQAVDTPDDTESQACCQDGSHAHDPAACGCQDHDHDHAHSHGHGHGHGRGGCGHGGGRGRRRLATATP
ncbi:NifB/NifX family molybdenum-iron cluster-binding protein [Roseospira visakhapatnamensis]|uniref:Putative Fe-Mo cluster-binding NifX family protein n=1 Tax=Roseospira visakhapatnamensis TaxID=390880 RepID=A0A7W6W8E9_9PROT|nr:NifB/NifX family molybdenum-iron cluster-binding protein [Roseospira visakhapatnamensis]MBB4264753.1 putative Fe-Mo cluster-binding NifX family protein [Roseospira visakhapatnamensis]